MLTTRTHPRPSLRPLATLRARNASRAFILLSFLRLHPPLAMGVLRRATARWDHVRGRGWVRVQSSAEEYDIDLITLRKVPRRRDSAVEAEAEAAGSKKEKEEEERVEKEKAEKEKKEREKAEKEKKEKEEKEKKEREKAEKEKKEKEKREKAEKEKKEKEKKEKAEKEKAEKEKAEKEKKEKEKKEKAEKEKAEKEKKEKEKAEKEKAEKEKAEKEKAEKEKAEKEKAEKEKAEKEKKEKERAEKEKAEKERAEKEKAEKERAEKEKAEKEKEKEKGKAEKEKKEKEKKEKEEKEKAKEKEKESRAPPKDTSPIDLPVKSTKPSTSEILAKIIKDQTQDLKKMAPPTLPEKPASRKEIVTPEPKAEVAKPKSQQPASAAQETEIADVTKVADDIPPPIKTVKVTASPAAGVPKSEKAAKSPQPKENAPKPHKLGAGKDPKGGQGWSDADIDLLLPSDVRKAAGIAPKPKSKPEPMSDPGGAKAKQTSAHALPPLVKKPRETPEELRNRMKRIAATLDLGPIENFIPPKTNHHDHAHDYEWSGTENVSTEDIIKPSSAIPTPPPPKEPAPVVPTLPSTKPPTPPSAAPAPTTTTPPPQTPYTYYVLVRNPASGAMHFTPLPSTLRTHPRESTAFDALRRLDAPECFLPLWRVLQRGGFEVVAGERECLVVKVEKEGARAKVEGVLAEMRGLVSPAERVAKEAWGRRRGGKETVVVEEEAEAPESRPRRKVFWGAVWVAGCTGAVTAGLESYM